jgi:hypothetical protein
VTVPHYEKFKPMENKPKLRKATLKGKPFRNEMVINNLKRILAHQKAKRDQQPEKTEKPQKS